VSEVGPLSYLLFFSWAPFGVVLVILRVVIFIIAFIMSVLLSVCHTEAPVHWVAFPLLGFWPKIDMHRVKAPGAPVILVSNHVSDFDGFALYRFVLPRHMLFVASTWVKPFVDLASRLGFHLRVVFRTPVDSPAPGGQ